MNHNIHNIKINELSISAQNVRIIDENDKSIKELSENIQNNGLINPLTVKYNKIKNIYEIIAGQRRYYAIKLLKYDIVPCTIIDNDSDEKKQIEISLIENIQRLNMKLSEKIKTYKKLETLYKNDIKNLWAVAK